MQTYNVILFASLGVALTMAAGPFLSGKAVPDEIREDFNFTTPEIKIICDTNGAPVDTFFIDVVTFEGPMPLVSWSSGGGAIAHQPGVTASSSGALSLTATIPNPGPDDARTYVCRAFKVGTFYRTFRFRVRYVPCPCRGVLDAILENEENIQNLTDILSALPPYEPQLNFTDDINALRYDLEALELDLNATNDRVDIVEDELVELDCELNNTNSLVDALNTALFDTSPSHAGNYYILSEYTPISYVSAQDFCVARGGSLAEIDDMAEYDFVVDFLYPIIGYQQLVLLGATRDANGTFINDNSGSPAFTNFFNEGDSGSGTGQDCLGLALNRFGEAGIKNDDTACEFLPWFPQYGWVHGFLCEVPANATQVCTA